MSDSKSSSTTPPRLNSPESYESAALEIEQEKQMVKALKRLSMGNFHDPDFTMEDPDLFLVGDRDRNDDSTVSLDTLSLSKSTSPESSESHSPPMELIDTASLPSKGTTSSNYSPQGTQYDSADSTTSSTQANPENLLWVPANLHPEVNPQQFKQHVKVTIDELLERKLSRSKSTRSKRSSLSLSTNDDSFNDNDDDNTKHDTSFQSNTPRNRQSNPSLLELSNELETLSRLAGMDSDDAVTIARSLSTHSIGYTEVEKAAIDELGSPHVSAGANQAEILDFGMDKSSGRTFPGQLPGSGAPMYRQYQSASPQREPRSPQEQSQQRFGPSDHQTPPEPGSPFPLKRSRRMNYRKAHTTQPTHLGSQLQNKKAGNLAELRHNLNSSMPMAYPNEPDARVKSSMSRQSMQSINPRSSQILFTYKGPMKLHGNKPPASAPPNSAPPSPVPGMIGGPMPGPRRASGPSMGQGVRDSPYGPSASSDLQQGHRSHSSQNLMNQRRKASGIPSHNSRENLQQNILSSGMVSQSGYPQASHPHPSNSPHMSRPSARKMSASSQHGADYGQAYGGRRKASPQQYSHPQFQDQVQSSAEHKQPHIRQGYVPSHGQYQRAPQPVNNVVGRARKHSHEISTEASNRVSQPVRHASDTRFDKTSQLNENLNMLRNEINEFRESLSHPESHKVPIIKEPEEEKATFSSALEDNTLSQPEVVVPDISFDISSREVSYEDTLGMEEDLFEQVNTDAYTSTPISSPKKHRSKEGKYGVLSDEVKPRKSNLSSSEKDPNFELQGVAETGNSPQPSSAMVSKVTPSFSEAKADHPPAVKESKDLTTDSRFETHVSSDVTPRRSSSKQRDDRRISEKTPDDRAQETKAWVENPMFATIESSDKQDDVELATDPVDFTPDLIHQPSRSSKEVEGDLKSAQPSPSMPVIDESKKLKKKKSFGSLNLAEKKKNKMGWLWSKGRSVSAQNLAQEVVQQEPTRSVSSPDIQSNKREHKEVKEPKEPKENKENKIAKFFKKKRSNSVSSFESPGTKSDAPVGDDKDQKTLKRISSAIFGAAKDEEGQRSGTKETKAVSLDEVKQELEKEDTEEISGKSSLLEKMKNKVRNSEDKTEESVAVATAEIDDSLDKSNECDEEEQKPQTTLEVQEKLKKSIKRTSKANQPLEYTDSAFGFPLPPPSVSTLIMLDYRFPVHVERAIYRLSHLKLANRKRSLREQVLLSNFMYAYLNLVDHTLHLEQRMSEEGSTAMEEPDADMDLFNDEDKDTDFESDDDSLEDNAFDNVRLDLRADPYNEITV